MGNIASIGQEGLQFHMKVDLIVTVSLIVLCFLKYLSQTQKTLQPRENFSDKKPEQVKLGHVERNIVGLEGGVWFAFMQDNCFSKHIK